MGVGAFKTVRRAEKATVRVRRGSKMKKKKQTLAPKRDLNGLIDRIARDIQSGALAPGMWLKQIDLEQRYAATRPNVRRALDRLMEKRLVRHAPNRGYHVFEADGRQVEELLELRLFLETAAAEKIVANATPDALRDLTALAVCFDELTITGSLLELYETNLAFHRRILELSHNAELVNLVGELRRRMSSAMGAQWRTHARIELSGREHHEMLAAIAEKNTPRLRDVVRAHILQPRRDS
jgi:DNA-binding GntR family transcriptional regulator